MAYNMNGLNFSYDYSELIEEIKQELEEGLLKNDTLINIVRSDEGFQINPDSVYYPIIDYYTLNSYEVMCELYNGASKIEDYGEENLEELKNDLEQYKKDEKNFELCTVCAVITEMEQWNNIM